MCVEACVCVWKGAGDNYIEVAGTGGLLIPNAVTLIKVGEWMCVYVGGLETTGAHFNPEQKKKKKYHVIYLIGNSSSLSVSSPAKLKKQPLCWGIQCWCTKTLLSVPLRLLGKWRGCYFSLQLFSFHQNNHIYSAHKSSCSEWHCIKFGGRANLNTNWRNCSWLLR